MAAATILDFWNFKLSRPWLSRPELSFTVLWLWYALGSIVRRVCSTDAFTADADYQLLLVCKRAGLSRMFSHIVTDIQYTFIVQLFTHQHPSSASLHHPSSFSVIHLIIHHTHSSQPSTAPAPIAAGRLGGFLFWLRPSQPGCRLSDVPSSIVLVRCCTSPLQRPSMDFKVDYKLEGE